MFNNRKIILHFIFVISYSPCAQSLEPITMAGMTSVIVAGTKTAIFASAKVVAAGSVSAITYTTISRMIPTPHDELAQKKAAYDLAKSQLDAYSKELDTEDKRLEKWDKLHHHCKDSSLATDECEQYRVFREELRKKLFLLVKNRPNSEDITQKNN